jgi:hypothetical protein
VHGGRDADPHGVQPLRHILLSGRRPGVVVLAVQHQDREIPGLGQLVGLIRHAEQLQAHLHEPRRAGTQHPVPQELDDWPGRAGGPGLGLQVALPDSAHLLRRDVGSQYGEHAAQFGRAVADERSGTRAHQREGAGLVVLQDGLDGHQAAERVAEQMQGAGGGHERCDIRAERPDVVIRRVVGAGRLVLAALVDGDHLAAGGREPFQHDDEVLLAARVTGNQDGRGTVSGSGDRYGLKRREHPSGGRDACSLDAFWQLEGGWSGHDVLR